MHWWQVAVTGNGIVAVAYFLISYAILVPLSRAGQVVTNRLGTATALIFFTCAVGHGLHSVHALLPFFGVTGLEADAGRSVEAHDAAWTVLTAVVGVYYWTLRRSYGQLLEGATLFQDQVARQQEAGVINDGIVQSLVAAKLAHRLGRDADVNAAIDAALVSSQDLVGRLLHDVTGDRPLRAGDFIRGHTNSRPVR